MTSVGTQTFSGSVKIRAEHSGVVVNDSAVVKRSRSLYGPVVSPVTISEEVIYVMVVK